MMGIWYKPAHFFTVVPTCSAYQKRYPVSIPLLLSLSTTIIYKANDDFLVDIANTIA